MVQAEAHYGTFDTADARPLPSMKRRRKVVYAMLLSMVAVAAVVVVVAAPAGPRPTELLEQKSHGAGTEEAIDRSIQEKFNQKEDANIQSHLKAMDAAEEEENKKASLHAPLPPKQAAKAKKNAFLLSKDSIDERSGSEADRLTHEDTESQLDDAIDSAKAAQDKAEEEDDDAKAQLHSASQKAELFEKEVAAKIAAQKISSTSQAKSTLDALSKAAGVKSSKSEKLKEIDRRVRQEIAEQKSFLKKSEEELAANTEASKQLGHDVLKLEKEKAQLEGKHVDSQKLAQEPTEQKPRLMMLVDIDDDDAIVKKTQQQLKQAENYLAHPDKVKKPKLLSVKPSTAPAKPDVQKAEAEVIEKGMELHRVGSEVSTKREQLKKIQAEHKSLLAAIAAEKKKLKEEQSKFYRTEVEDLAEVKNIKAEKQKVKEAQSTVSQLTQEVVKTKQQLAEYEKEHKLAADAVARGVELEQENNDLANKSSKLVQKVAVLEVNKKLMEKEVQEVQKQKEKMLTQMADEQTTI